MGIPHPSTQPLARFTDMFAAATRSLPSASRTFGARSFSASARANDVAKMILVGRIGATPNVGTTRNDKPYVSYKIATTDPYVPPREGEEPTQPTTSWHTIFAYGPAVERLQTLEKGTLVMVERTESGEYTTAILARHEKMNVLKRPN